MEGSCDGGCNRFVHEGLLALADIPGYLMCNFLAERKGRRWTQESIPYSVHLLYVTIIPTLPALLNYATYSTPLNYSTYSTHSLNFSTYSNYSTYSTYTTYY